MYITNRSSAQGRATKAGSDTTADFFDDALEGGVPGSGGQGGSGAPTADGDNGAESPTGFSDTNRQVGDVDEADIVKVGDDGQKLYVIRGDGFH